MMTKFWLIALKCCMKSCMRLILILIQHLHEISPYTHTERLFLFKTFD